MTGNPYGDPNPLPDASDTAAGSAGNSAAQISWPTVLASVGVSTLASAVVIALGSVGLLHYSSTLAQTAASAQPTVSEIMLDSGNSQDVDTEAAGAATPSRATVPSTTRSTTSVRTSTRAATSTAAAGAGTGAGTVGGGGTSATVGGTGSGGGEPVSVVVVDESGQVIEETTVDSGTGGGTQTAGDAGGQTAVSLPASMNSSELQSHLTYLLNSGTSDAEIAANLEAGQVGVPTIRTVSERLGLFSAIYKWKIKDGSAYVDGETLYATLELSLTGYGTKEEQLSFIAQDGRWKLSNASLCTLAISGRTTCPV